VSLPPFQELVDTHWRDVVRVALALAGPSDAEDVAQQAWTQALAAYPGLRTASNLRGWLLTVTARCAIDAHRARARRPVPAAQLPEQADGPRGLDAVEQGDGPLWRAVRSLSQRQRTAVVLRYVADLDHAQVARAMGTTPTATRRLVSDALTTLRATVPTMPEEDL
jgi:RNA polymerase sigma factor (sigma-70 family)